MVGNFSKKESVKEGQNSLIRKDLGSYSEKSKSEPESERLPMEDLHLKSTPPSLHQ